MRVVSHPETDRELKTATQWYELRELGMGEAFIDEFESALQLIVGDPRRPRKIRGSYRKRNLRRFPYAIIYSVRDDVIYVKALMHLHRRPFYWARR